jgi:formamidopyrimidine-DNA glycosylase
MQEMLFRAGILPTRRVASLDRDERRRLHRAIRGVLAEATKKGGSADSCDIYGRPGGYVRSCFDDAQLATGGAIRRRLGSPDAESVEA